MPNPSISVKDVTLSLGGRQILTHVSLAVEAQEFVGVLGANGAGKTTLFRAILGLVKPSTGAIRVLGQPAGARGSAVGYMPQTRNLAPASRLSGWEFVAAAANGHRLGLPRLNKTDREDVERVLGLVGGNALAARPLANLSGGERQRLLLAQALLGAPKLLLLDEPLISLDPHRQTEVVELIHKLQRELGIAVLFSAHELNPLLGALDRVLYLGGGHAAIGTVEEVITGPVLSRLYGTPIEVLQVQGRIFVMAGGHDVERDHHSHD